MTTVSSEKRDVCSDINRHTIARAIAKRTQYLDRYEREDDTRERLGNAWTYLVSIILNQDRWGKDKAGELAGRVGNTRYEWSPRGVASMPSHELRDCIRWPKAVIRYYRRATDWLSASARLIVERYNGRAARIWEGASGFKDLLERLCEIPGISQKKAHLYARVLGRRQRFTDWHEVDVAVDVHTRRVFYKCGLSASPRSRDIIQAARELRPDYPGILDRGAWDIGKYWCHKTTPDCGGAKHTTRKPCPIGQWCLRRRSPVLAMPVE